MKKRVCMLITDAVSFNVLCRGQLEFFCDNYDIELTLLCGGSREELDALRRRNVGKVVYVPFCRKPSPFQDFWCLVKLLFFLLFNRFDVVVYSTPKAMFLGALSAFFSFQKKRISVIRGRAYEGFSGLKRRIYIWFDRLVVALSSFNLVISDSLRRSYICDGFKADDFTVLGAGSSNGVDLERFSNIRKAKGEGGEFTVGVIGRICRDKGIEQVEKVINRVINEGGAVRFLLVGSIEDRIGRVVIDRLLEYESVTHLPHIDKIEEIFMSLDLHLFLTHREGFGNVAIEAAACSVPTFAFDVVGVRDSVKNGVSGELFDFLDVEKLSDAVIDAVRNPKVFKDRFSESRRWVVENFERESVWHRYFSFYLK
ncbi:glycosyltransferase [Alloalcanivorax xenomutans]|uniref:glycosyltransferase n=1 Tax=Alloalcanivorax xenomutans TaxID=1094342 RepID=UPI0029301BEF|nr:glycosyltransferase [Alloalcanivorax xenomutans]WOA33081.1 glycosyltransferase [Alloalcanivorax xenomutans]